MDLEVKAYMTGAPVFIEPEAPALAALDLMIDAAIRHLPVVDRSDRLLGVVSFDDLRAALPIPISLEVPLSAETRQRVLDQSVGDVMTYSPVTVASDASLEEAVEKMLEGRFGCLPVLDEDGRLDGILTETDLLHALATVLWTMRGRESIPEADDLVGRLEKERAHLVERLNGYEDLEQDLTRTRRETPMDLAEQGETVERGALTEELAAMASRRLRSIENALERAAEGTLERCERCGERIPEARLRAAPGATLCIRCGRAAETPE